MNPSPMWYASRGTGYVSLVLLTATVALGVLTSVRFARPGWPRFLSQSVHRSVSLLVMVFLGIHIVTAIADPFAGLGLRDAVVPWGSPYRPLWMGSGVVAFELLCALAVTSLLRRRINFTAWRAIHALSYVSWPVALVHGLGTGSDARSWWGLGLDIACGAVVLGAIAARSTLAFPRFPAAASSGLVVAGIVTVLITAWMLTGPLAPGWAAASGTPSKLLAPAAGATSGSATPNPSPQFDSQAGAP